MTENDTTDWEKEAAEVSEKLSRLQSEAPLDVAGFLQEADRNVTFALRKYRDNRSENDNE